MLRQLLDAARRLHKPLQPGTAAAAACDIAACWPAGRRRNSWRSVGGRSLRRSAQWLQRYSMGSRPQTHQRVQRRVGAALGSGCNGGSVGGGGGGDGAAGAAGDAGVLLVPQECDLRWDRALRRGCCSCRGVCGRCQRRFAGSDRDLCHLTDHQVHRHRHIICGRLIRLRLLLLLLLLLLLILALA